MSTRAGAGTTSARLSVSYRHANPFSSFSRCIDTSRMRAISFEGSAAAAAAPGTVGGDRSGHAIMLFLSSIKENKLARTSRNLSASAPPSSSSIYLVRPQLFKNLIASRAAVVGSAAYTRASRTEARFRNMRYSALCVILVLAITDSVFAQAQPEKVVLVIPQRTRRMGATSSLRPVISRYRKSSHGGELDQHRRYHPVFYRQTKRPGYGKPAFPHGGDDFDQGYEHVNHIHVPYGKGISHALTFGKGYIPYDRIKVRGRFSLGGERHPGAQEQQSSEPEYSSSPFASSGTGSSYTSSGPSFEPSPSESETFFSSPESAMSYNEGLNEDESQKFYASRSIEKDTTVNSPIDISSTGGKEQFYLLQQKGTTQYYGNTDPSQIGGVSLPSGVPSPTIGGSKDGIVLRDSVAIDEYRQKVQEMTKSWPQFMQNPSVANYNFQSQPSGSYSIGYSSPGSITGTYNWPVSFAQPKQGYAVKEDTMESSHDFRTMPVNTSPYQSGTIPMNAQISALGVTQALIG